MRTSLLLAPLAIIALSACASGGAPVSQQTTTTQTTYVNSANYLSAEQSSHLIMLPGDTTTPAQLRFLAQSHATAPDNNSPLASTADPTPAEIAPLLAGNFSR